MPKYIEVEALGVDRCNPDVVADRAYAAGWNRLINIINSAPTADVAPVVHGRWIDTGEDDGNGNYAFHCSVCGYTDIHSRSVAVPYCWHCGALMDGKDEGNG